MRSKRLLLLAILVVGTLVAASPLSAVERGIRIKVKDKAGATVALYEESHALVVGISDYTNGWRRLRGVEEDIPAVKEALEKQGFAVTVVMNPDREGLDRAFRSFVNRHGLESENRLLFYFAGHGHSMKLGYGGLMGYLVGRDAPNPRIDKAGFRDKSLSMRVIETYARNIESKHALFLFDACFSGLVFDATRAVPDAIAVKTGRPVRQFITSGTADQKVPDRSVFRRQFVAALEGEGDLDRDGYVTGAELGQFLETTVANYTRRSQTPQYGKLRDPLLDKGDFVFALPGKAGPTEPSGPSASAGPNVEVLFWQSIEGSRNPADFEAYLDQFPQGVFSRLARNRLEDLQPSQVALATPADDLAGEMEPSRPESGDLREVQRLLGELGYDPGPVDGVMGRRTRTAIKSFQRSHGQTVDGKVSAELLTVLQALHRADPQAIKFYRAALDRDPDNVNLLYRAVVLMITEGRLDDAVPLAKRLVALTEDTGQNVPIASLAIAVDEVRRGQYSEADQRMAGESDNGISPFLGPFLRAWAQLGDGRVDEAIKTLKAIDESHGLQTLQDLYAGLIFQLSGRMESAAESFTAATEGEGAQYLRAAELAGEFFEIVGDRQKAREIYETYLASDPGSHLFDPALARLEAGTPPEPDIATVAHGVAQVMFDIAVLFRGENAGDAGLVFGRFALDLKPDFPIAKILVADILESSQRLESAVKVYQSIQEDSPHAYPASLRVAVNLNKFDRVNEAVSVLQRTSEAYPDESEPLITLGDILRGRERYVEAVGAYDQAIARVGTLERRHWSLLYTRGVALERLKQWDRAEADFLKALELEPSQPLVLNHLGYSWVDKGLHLERGMKMIEQAAELRPNDGLIADSLGWAYYRLDAYEEAVFHLERAERLAPEHPVINDHLGDAYWKVGRRQDARSRWRQALALNPAPETVDLIEAKLRYGLIEADKAGR